jgi:predicted AlkP superfamily phosphohydrolase/phosphomutase
VLIGWGPDIREGVVVTDARICDITPTILYLLNQPIPEDMDGWVVTDLFRETYV